jgi:hypothetical protein
MATNHRDAELAGADWGLSSSIRLTRCTRESWRSFRAAYRGLGMPAAAGLEITGTRVSVSCKETRGKGGTRAPRLIRSGGTLFITVGGGRRLPSWASTRRRRIGRLAALHRAASS